MRFLILIFTILSVSTFSKCQPVSDTVNCERNIEKTIYYVVGFLKDEIKSFDKQIKRKNAGKSYSAMIDFTKHSFIIENEKINATIISQGLTELLNNEREEIFINPSQDDKKRINEEFCTNTKLELVSWPKLNSNNYYILKNSSQYRGYCFQIFKLSGNWIKIEVENQVPQNAFWSFGRNGFNKTAQKISVYAPIRISQKPIDISIKETSDIILWKNVQ